jgi:predicted RNA-binding Zn-ribbon protein involved in translation (DUF1610 family)
MQACQHRWRTDTRCDLDHGVLGAAFGAIVASHAGEYARMVPGRKGQPSVCERMVTTGATYREGVALAQSTPVQLEERVVAEVRRHEPARPVAMSCTVCGAKMQEVAQVPAFANQPELIAFECPNCGHVDSILRPM